MTNFLKYNLPCHCISKVSNTAYNNIRSIRYKAYLQLVEGGHYFVGEMSLMNTI